MKKVLNLLLLFLTGISITSCQEKEDPLPPTWPDADHTLLIYMIADNNLSSYCAVNINSAINGLLDWESPINLVIYEDNRSYGENGKPKLYQLKRNFLQKEKIDTIMIHQFTEDHNSADPEIFHAIVEEAFHACPAKVKGLELWSHGSGWTPGDDYQATRAARNEAAVTRTSRFIGIDNSSFLEIWDLRKALEKSPHLDYLIFDACNMAQAEVAYELRNIADYMLACPTEIMAEGLPYAVMVKSLSACSSKEMIIPAMQHIFEEFASHYPGTNTDNGGTLTLLDLTKVSTLRENYKALLAACEKRRSQLEDRPHTYENYMQRFGRLISKDTDYTYYFYDIESVADFMASGWTTDMPEYHNFEKALNAVVIKEYHTSRLLDLNIRTCCGLGVGVPEIFGNLPSNKHQLISAYNELQWVKD